MASGGNFPPPVPPTTRTNNRVENECVVEPPWLLTANNLSLHTSASENRLSKKQRNKTKPRLFPAAAQLVESRSKMAQSRKSSESEQQQTSEIQKKKKPKENMQNGKQDNTNKLPDTSILVERLSHLRDCIKQVTSIMLNLEKTDGPVSRSQLGNLDQMLGQLRNEEKENLQLLQQLLAFGEQGAHVNGVTSGSSTCSDVVVVEDHTPEVIQVEVNDNGQEEEEMDEDDEEKQNELLAKMLSSQKKLASLREQQNALLTMQRKAESRLAQVKAFHEHLLQSGVSVDEVEDWTQQLSLAGGATSVVDAPSRLSTKSSTPPAFNGIKSSLEIHQNGIHINQNNNQQQQHNNNQSAAAAAPIKKETRKKSENGSDTRLAQFQAALADLGLTSNSRSEHHPTPNPLVVEPTLIHEQQELTDTHRKKLENKLRELQEKKQQMDSLLQELSSLQVQPPQLVQEVQAANKPIANGNLDSAFALQDAQMLLESSETIDKMHQLEELKKKLTQLKVLTDNLEFGGSAAAATASGTTLNNKEGSADLPENWTRQTRNKKEKTPVAIKSDNLHRDHTSPGFPARRHYEAEGRANEDADAGVLAAAQPIIQSPDSASTISPSAPITSLQEQALMEEHAEIEAKVSKLVATKHKLQQLQGLLGAVNQYRRVGEPLPDEVDDFLHDLQSTLQQEQTEQQQSQDDQSLKNNEQRSSGEGKSVVRTRPANAPSNLVKASRNHISEQSLSDLNEELNHSLALRDELQHQKSVLQELLRQEQNKQIGFSHNQDNRSESDKSELAELGSTVAPDTTAAATWGGSSTQDNLDDDPEEEEEQLESLEEEDEEEKEAQEQLQIDVENCQRRRNNRTSRVHGYRRGLMNQWRKTFQTFPVSNRKNDQPPPEDIAIVPPVNNPLESQPQTNSELQWRQFTQHIQKQLEQTNSLCQSVLKDQQTLGSMLFSQQANLATVAPSGALGPPQVHVPSQQVQHPQEAFRYYSHLQQQQQLLLNLSQCYHMLYLQQVEILSLQSYLQQAPDAEPVARASPLNPTEEVRPSWCPWVAPPTAPLAPPPTHLVPHHSVTAMPSTHHHSPQLHSPFAHPPAATASAVVAPFFYTSNTTPNSAQDERGAAETLNNQLPPPGTRANNFLDNFRSYSRPNLLSPKPPTYSFCDAGASASRGATAPTIVPPQPLLPNQSRKSSTPNSSGGVRPRTKRPNLDQSPPVRRTPGCLNLLSLYEPKSNSDEMVVAPPPVVENVQTGRISENVNCDSLRDSIYMEVTSLISNFEQQPDLLMDLLKQLQQLGPPTISVAPPPPPPMTAGRFVSSLNELLRNPCNRRGKQMGGAPKRQHNLSFDLAPPLLVPSLVETESGLLIGGEDSSSSSNSWPKGSSATGAVQKKFVRHYSVGSSSFAPPPPESNEEVSSDNLVKQTVLSLVPFLQTHANEECTPHLQAQLCNQILSALQNLPVHQPLLRFFRSQLLQSLQQMLSKYCGLKVRECEQDMLMEITEVVVKEMAIQKIMQKKKDERQRGDWSSVSVNRGSQQAYNGQGGGVNTDFESNDGRFASENETEDTNREWTESTFPNDDGNRETEKTQLDLQPDRLDVRAAPDGLAAAPPMGVAMGGAPPTSIPPHMVVMVHPLSPRLLEEESGYDCDAEGETEPEMEAETDDTKDLAEADQSANRNVATQEQQEEECGGAEAAPQEQGAEGEELSLDDIPTKLETLDDQGQNNVSRQQNDELLDINDRDTISSPIQK